MKGNNYSAWEIIPDEFFALDSDKEKMSFIVSFAVLAPSAHNAQPWAFSIKNNCIEVYKEHARRLLVGDANERQLFLSIGCAIENILIAADYFGYSVKLEYVENDQSLVAKIHLSKDSAKLESRNAEHLIYSILTRKTNRLKYLPRKIEMNILDIIKKTPPSEIKLHIVHDKSDIFELGEIAVLASIESAIDRNFRKELSGYVTHNLTKSKIGMPGFTQGIPTIVSFPLSSIIRRFNMERIARKKNLSLFDEYTPYIFVLSTKNDDTHSWLEAGRTFERIALILNKHGIGVSPWGAPIQIGSFYQDIQVALHTLQRPQMFFRVGYPIKDVRYSPRLPVKEVLK